ncbi:sugar dehydrogenase complex small subunit [Aestuariivirga sp.]|uniref:sugar dehydrogenase complex small subunit n=1 Tax=Aestuariivirga sp. TaxID=2650926 RepID=UPI003BAA1358
MKSVISRRAVIQAVTLCATSGAAGWVIGTPADAASSDVSIDAFMVLSRKLTVQQDLDAAMGAAILQGFKDAGKRTELGELISGGGTEAGRRKIANDVVAAWYSGFSPDPQATYVAGFNSALVWSALTYTKPWANCGGETGYWANPPAG